MKPCIIIKSIAMLSALFLCTGCADDSGNAVTSLPSRSSHSGSSSAAASSSSVSEQSSTVLSQKADVSASKPTVSVKEPEIIYNEKGIAKYNGTRDPWLWPFAEDSIWNMPIGSGAKLKKAGFKMTDSFSLDEEYLVIVPKGSPTVKVYSPSEWNKRWPGDQYLGEMQVPADFYCPDAEGYSTPNACSAFLMPDGRTIRQLEPTCRIETGDEAQIVGWLHKEDQDIYSAGIKGTHYGSGLSAIGGSIRKGELISDEPIRHALKLNVWAKRYLYYDVKNDCGYVWPADRHDSCAAPGPGNDQAYGGTDPALRMGSLLTIPQDVTAEKLGIETEVGKKLFYALQNYGCYIVDNSAFSDYGWSAEIGVRKEVRKKYGFDMFTSNHSDQYYKDCINMIGNLYIVTNNSPTSIGGGTPCKPLAPDFKK